MDIQKHKNIFIGILREIYSDSILRSSLGFKGGTCAMLFYDLPRFSVDLDFDLIDETKQDVVFLRLKKILPKFGVLSESTDKHFTLFFLLSYEKNERNLKIEISKRPVKHDYFLKNYFGISMLVTSEADMLASKLSALITRKKFANRDVFDTWFFLKNNWEINQKLFEEITGMTMNMGLKKAQKLVSGVKRNQVLSGLGELLDEKQKVWVKTKLIEETIFLLRLYEKNPNVLK
jgi:predicted nucleotidyltransferase component of viral defense system